MVLGIIWPTLVLQSIYRNEIRLRGPGGTDTFVWSVSERERIRRNYLCRLQLVSQLTKGVSASQCLGWFKLLKEPSWCRPNTSKRRNTNCIERRLVTDTFSQVPGMECGLCKPRSRVLSAKMELGKLEELSAPYASKQENTPATYVLSTVSQSRLKKRISLNGK